MEGREGSEEEGKQYDEAPPSSNEKTRKSPGVEEDRSMEGRERSQEEGKEYDEDTPSSNEKKRKSPGAEEDPSTSRRADGNGSGQRKSKKIRDTREEIEAIHAESQRLLRETRGTSFAPEQVLQKPVSSLIEKIRQRRLQLTHSASKMSTSRIGGSQKFLTRDLKDASDGGKVSDEGTEQNDEIEFVMYKPPTRETVKQEPGEPSTSGTPRDETNENTPAVEDTDEAGAGGSSRPKTPDTRCGRSISTSECKSPPRSFLRAPLVESQDLYSDSQLSPFRDESPVAGDEEDAVAAVGFKMNLHLDSETQDDDPSRWLEEDDEKENRDPTARSSPELFPSVSHVRGLVDDEAEDEDDDPLQDEDDEDDDTGGEVRDLLTQNAGERPVDIERRSELHSKWLEQQDLDIEDNILHRIESGWKSRGKKEIPAFLSDKQETTFSGDDLRPCRGYSRLVESATADIVGHFEILKDQFKDTGLTKGATTSNSQNEAYPMDQSDFQESSDDEEAEERLRRQIFLQESEELTEFLSVTDDESSREIFSLINKVNVTTIKPRTVTAHSEVRTSGTVHHHPSAHHHQSSFLRRKAAVAVTTTRQGSGNSRSYVFGRDDSNSRDSSRFDDKKEQQAGKAKSSFTSLGEEQRLNSTNQLTQKSASTGVNSSLPKEVKPRGPSLFQVLKQQAAELASGKTTLDLSGSSSRGDDLSIFLAIRPSKKPRGSRGT